MNNNISALNNALFESLERLQSDDLDDDGLKREIARANAVSNTAGMIIQNAELALKAQVHADEYGKRTQITNPLLVVDSNGE